MLSMEAFCDERYAGLFDDSSTLGKKYAIRFNILVFGQPYIWSNGDNFFKVLGNFENVLVMQSSGL